MRYIFLFLALFAIGFFMKQEQFSRQVSENTRISRQESRSFSSAAMDPYKINAGEVAVLKGMDITQSSNNGTTDGEEVFLNKGVTVCISVMDCERQKPIKTEYSADTCHQEKKELTLLKQISRDDSSKNLLIWDKNAEGSNEREPEIIKENGLSLMGLYNILRGQDK